MRIMLDTSLGIYCQAYMGITGSPLPQNQGKLPIPPFGGNFYGNFA